MSQRFGAVVAAVLSPCLILQVHCQEEFTIQERLRHGVSVEVTTSVSLDGTITESSDAKKTESVKLTAFGQSHYRERVLEVDRKGDVSATIRRYITASLEKQRNQGKQRIQARSDVERVSIQRTGEQNTVLSPDGPLTGPELDLFRAETFVPALRGLLPAGASKVGDKWVASGTAASELTGVEPIQSGGLSCTFQEVKETKDATVARIGFSGTVVGPTDQGLTRLAADGHLLFDLDQQLITYVLMNGRSEILDSGGKVTGHLDGRYEFTRRPAIDDPKLTDSAIAGIELKPTPETTALLFDGADLGLQFLYPRNWELSSVSRNVLQFDEPTGGNLRVTIDANPSPTAEKLRSELLNWLKSQKATVTESEPVQALADAAIEKSEQFSVRAQHQQRDKEWTYAVVSEGNRSVAIASNLIQERADALREDVLFVARSMKFMPKDTK